MLPIWVSNDARKIDRFLASKFPDRQMDIDEAIAIEQAILQYYPNPIINVMTSMLNAAKPDKLPSYADFRYHSPGLRRITSKRVAVPPIIFGDIDFKTLFIILQGFLVYDYNYDALLQIIDISKVNMDIITDALVASKNADVRTIPYLYAIVQRRLGEKRAKAEQLKKLTDAAEKPVEITKPNGLSTLEVASVEGMWDTRREDLELERMMETIRRRGHH